MLFGGDHYTSFKIEPIDAIRDWLTPEAFEGFLRGNVIKYVVRYKKKGGVADLKKASDYLSELINHLEREGVGRDESR